MPSGLSPSKRCSSRDGILAADMGMIYDVIYCCMTEMVSVTPFANLVHGFQGSPPQHQHSRTKLKFSE